MAATAAAGLLRPKPPNAGGAADVVTGATAATAGVGATAAVVVLGAPNPGFAVQGWVNIL